MQKYQAERKAYKCFESTQKAQRSKSENWAVVIFQCRVNQCDSISIAQNRFCFVFSFFFVYFVRVRLASMAESAVFD